MPVGSVRFVPLAIWAALAAIVAGVALLGPVVRPAWAIDGQLVITALDEKTHKPVACRMHLVGANKKPRTAAPAPFWSDHFVLPGKIALKLPLGHYTFEVERGPEYKTVDGNFTIEHFADDSKEIELHRFTDMSEEGWWSGDLLVRRPARDIEQLMAADDLHVAQVVTWWNDKSEGTGRPASKNPLVHFDKNRWYQVMAGGYSRAGTEVLCLGLPAPMLWPRNDPECPTVLQQLLKIRQEHRGLWVDLATSYGRDLPLLVAHGQVDSIEVANSHLCRKTVLADEAGGKPRDRDQYQGPFGYARWSQDVYFKLLDCGLRIPPTAGSGSGITPNPVGYNRVYVHLDGEFNYADWWKNLRAGQVVVTNGPLLRPKVEGQLPGYVFHGDEGKEMELQIGLTLSTREPLSYLDIVQDGQVAHSIRIEEFARSGRLPKLHFTRSGWFVIRAVTDLSETYRFAMTAPYYVEIGTKPRISKQAARFFLDWVYEQARQIAIEDPQQRREVIEYHRKARDFWQDLVKRATAD